MGIMGMLVTVALQTLLVFGKVKYEQTIAALLTACGAIGIRLLLEAYLALTGGVLPGGIARLGLVAGSGYILLIAGFWLGSEQNPLFWADYLGMVISYSVWAIWLGRALLLGPWSASR
jgi:hypothetical protein